MSNIQQKPMSVLGILKVATLCHIKAWRKESVILVPITAKEEKSIDVNNRFTLNLNSGDYTIPMDNIYMYGDINPDNDDDLDMIFNQELIDSNEDTPCFVPSSFDYDKAEIIAIDNIVKRSPTWKPIKWFKWNYTLIGKPSKVVCCKVTTNILANCNV